MNAGHDYTTTRLSIVVGMKAEDDHAWERFFRLYAPPTLARLRRWGLDAWDAEDVLQHTLLRLRRDVRSFDPGKGHRFHSLVIQAYEWAARDFVKIQRAQKRDVRRTVSGDAPVHSGRGDVEAGASVLEGVPAAPSAGAGAGAGAGCGARDQERAQEIGVLLDEALDVELKRGQARNAVALRQAYLDWFWSQSTDEEIGSRHGLKAHQFKYFREKMADRLKDGADL